MFYVRRRSIGVFRESASVCVYLNAFIVVIYVFFLSCRDMCADICKCSAEFIQVCLFVCLLEIPVLFICKAIFISFLHVHLYLRVVFCVRVSASAHSHAWMCVDIAIKINEQNNER